jgi:hypothetical protein
LFNEKTEFIINLMSGIPSLELSIARNIFSEPVRATVPYIHNPVVLDDALTTLGGEPTNDITFTLYMDESRRASVAGFGEAVKRHIAKINRAEYRPDTLEELVIVNGQYPNVVQPKQIDSAYYHYRTDRPGFYYCEPTDTTTIAILSGINPIVFKPWRINDHNSQQTEVSVDIKRGLVTYFTRNHSGSVHLSTRDQIPRVAGW